VKRHLLRHLLLTALLLAAVTNSAQAWWDSTWTLRRKLTLDTTAVSGAGALGSGPILIRLYDGNFRFDAAKPDGSDLRFVAEDDKTLLSYHIEKFDPLLNEAFVWVKVPDLKPGAKNTLWLYYGNSGNKAVKVEDSKATYDDSTVLVYHFAEHGQAPFDSSGAGNNALNSGTAADGAEIGTGLRLDGRTPINVPAAPSLAWPNEAAFTWSCWVKSNAPQANAVLLARRATGKAVVIGMDNGVPFVEVRGGGATERTSPGAPLPAGSTRWACRRSPGRPPRSSWRR
jgi:biopolymer transport protein ExbB